MGERWHRGYVVSKEVGDRSIRILIDKPVRTDPRLHVDDLTRADWAGIDAVIDEHEAEIARRKSFSNAVGCFWRDQIRRTAWPSRYAWLGFIIAGLIAVLIYEFAWLAQKSAFSP